MADETLAVRAAEALPGWAGSIRFRLMVLYSVLLFGLATVVVGGIYAGLARSLEDQDVSRTEAAAVLFRDADGRDMIRTLEFEVQDPLAVFEREVNEQALAQRRSLRDFGADPLSLEPLSQVLWGAQGLSDAAGYRTAPSAGALYPLEIYVLVGRVTGLDPGVYKYRAASHDLVRTGEGDLRAEAAEIALGQSWVAAAPAVLVVAAVFARTTAKYGRRGERYVYMEAGHAAQNVYLQATALDLGVTVVGAFDDVRLHGLVGMERDESPLSLLPLGTTS